MSILVILFILIKNIIYGLSVYFTGSLSKGIDVLDILALRFLMSFIVLLILKYTHVLKIEVGLKDIFGKTQRSKYTKSLILTGIFEPTLYMLFETFGISMTTGITAAVILALGPIFNCIFEPIFLKEKSSFIKKIFLLLGVIGVIYIALNTNTSDGSNSVLGIIYTFLAVVCGSLYCVFSRKSSKHFHAFEVTYITCMLGTVVFNFVNVIRHILHGNLLDYFRPYLSVDNLIGFAYLSILSTIVATAMNNYALSKAQVSTLGAFAGVSTLTAIAADVLLNGEQLYTFQIIGVTLIVICIIGANCTARNRKKG